MKLGIFKWNLRQIKKTIGRFINYSCLEAILWTAPTNSREQQGWNSVEFIGMPAFDFPICSTRKNVASFSFSGATSIAFGCFAIRIFPLLHSVCAIPPRSDTLNKIFFSLFFPFSFFSFFWPRFTDIRRNIRGENVFLVLKSRHLVRKIVIKSTNEAPSLKFFHVSETRSV